MNQHIEDAQAIRNAVPMCHNCAQTILSVYAEELGLTEGQACSLAANFGGGMKCGKMCGAVSAGLMVLGAKGVQDPNALAMFRRSIAQNHGGYLDCADLLRLNAEQGGQKKPHCDGMICEAIELIDQLTGE